MPTWRSIFKTLQIAGIEVYAPGQKQGVCASPYAVLLEESTIPTPHTGHLGMTIFSVIVYVPLSHYSALEPYKATVRKALCALPGLSKTGLETPSIIEDDYQAHSSSMEYIIQRRLE